jgi:hypothetical protein
MNTERNLALGVMESIEYMTGHAPRPRRYVARFASWLLVGCGVLALIAGVSQ